MRRQWVLITLGWVAIGLAILAGLAYFTDIFKNNPIPKNVRTQVHFATYYPSSLPEGYTIKPNSYEVANEVLLYTILGPKKQTITISEQSPPDSFNFEDFQNNTLKNTRTSQLSGNERVYIGTIGTNYVASIRTESTWILVSGNRKSTNMNTIETIAKALRT